MTPLRLCRQHLATALAYFALASAAGCKQAASAPEPTPTANIQVGTVHMQPVADTLQLPGRVQADPAHLVHIYAPLSGRLLNLSLAPGQEIRKGQTVATLQSGDVAQARADFEKAHIETVRADGALARGKLLAAHEVLSQADLQELQATAEAAHAEQERARQRVHELGFSENGTSDLTNVTSPISGTVLEIGTAAGEMQRSLETTTGIATVANLDTVWVAGDLYEQDLAAVHLHDSVTVLFPAYPGERFRGTVSNIGDALDPATHAVKVRVVLANPKHRLKPDMFATLEIARPGSARILIPQGAVLHDGNVTEVYVPAGGGKYVTRTVTTGPAIGNQVEITGGLRDGEQIVTAGAAFLREPAGD
ncbi:MAG TPA: efflux RND transporter periplasmic adaptor subunit [Acidobacteriaceae bacterium]|jgi:cobalt-zinc-cadmium efflux system membrane fusion protein|nr:efflux RND transporter periplasmic adaptor subunit [Acidobacteriaceae bacterium]